jgi:hypothetical protein
MSDVRRRNSQSRESAAGIVAKVARDKDKREVNLRNGAKSRVELVMGELRFLQGLAEYKPAYFQMLLSLAQGKEPTGPRRILAELKRSGSIKPDGSLNKHCRDVLLSACQESSEGIVLGNPFAPKDEAEAAFVQTYITASDDRLIRLARKLGLDRPPDGDGESPTR